MSELRYRSFAPLRTADQVARFLVDSAAPSLTPGQKLGRYDLLAPVARGGMGQVWVARLRGARGFHKLVAIKTLICPRGDEARMERMLLEEARIAALIQHSNVVQTLELGEHEGTLYLVMEWVDGESLSDLIAAAERGGGIPLLVAVNLIAQTLRGLQAAHELGDDSGAPLGVVHRDVSPHNVLVTYSGVAKLADFGIARAELGPTRDTPAVEGKIPFMAPEQILGGKIDQRTDLFSVGVLLYQLTTGRHPFKDNGVDGVLHAITSDEPAVRPSLIVPAYSRTLEAVVLKALEKDRERRWPSAEEMRLALERGVPQAFGLGFEAQLRNFMTDLVGIRALRKREALRRAELAADAYAQHGGVVPDSVPAPSAGSLRAILIDAEHDEALPEVVVPLRKSRMPTLRPLAQLARDRAHGWSLPAIAGSLVLAALLMILLRDPRAGEPSVASPGASMVEWSSPSAVPTTKVIALPASAPSANAVASAAPSASVAPSEPAFGPARPAPSTLKSRKRR